jgi:hypothetical protein
MKGVNVFGIILIILGIILAVVLYPLVGYASASETADELGGFSFETFTGKEVKFKGTIKEVWTDSIPYMSEVFELINLCVVSIEDLEVGGIFGGTTPVIIFCNNMDVNKGDEVTVEGYVFGIGEATIIIGESGIEAVSKMYMGIPPDSANVEKVPHAGFYVGIGVLVVGFILLIVGSKSTKRAGTSTSGVLPSTQQPQQQSQPYYQLQQSQQNPQQPPQQQYPCLTCGRGLTFIPQYQRWYCSSCNRYF